MPNLWAICVMQAFQKAEAASPKSHGKRVGGNNGNSAIPKVFAFFFLGGGVLEVWNEVWIVLFGGEATIEKR